MSKPKTKPVRVPEDMAQSLKRVAALNGITPAEQMDRAWREWMQRNQEPTGMDMGAAVEAMRHG